MKTRFAPSPTGDLHLGGALVAVASAELAKRSAGAFVVRVEDLDPPRVVRGAEARILDDLAWLGMKSDEPVVRQSERGAIYERAIATLAERALVYPCDCSRAEIARVASAPHEGEELRYPGTCRDKDPLREMKREPALRVRVPDGERSFVDHARGRCVQDLARDVGDFVLRRGDGVFSYQLAVTVDDTAQAIDLVIRGEDLLPSTLRQLYLAEMLGCEHVPKYAHVPLVVDSTGQRLAKRTRARSVRELRAAGVLPRAVRAALEHAVGLHDPTGAWPKTPFFVPKDWEREQDDDPR
ncbi:tRNA glutamyl-Q(34) synthetase GluQRS [soil metagenome]